MESEEGNRQPITEVIEIQESVLEESRPSGINYAGEREEGEVLATEHGNDSYESGYGNVFVLEMAFHVQGVRTGQ